MLGDVPKVLKLLSALEYLFNLRIEEKERDANLVLLGVFSRV